MTFAVLCGRRVIPTFSVTATNRPRSHLSCSLESLQAARTDLNASQAASLLVPPDEIDDASHRGHTEVVPGLELIWLFPAFSEESDCVVEPEEHLVQNPKLITWQKILLFFSFFFFISLEAVLHPAK